MKFPFCKGDVQRFSWRDNALSETRRQKRSSQSQIFPASEISVFVSSSVLSAIPFSSAIRLVLCRTRIPGLLSSTFILKGTLFSWFSMLANIAS